MITEKLRLTIKLFLELHVCFDRVVPGLEFDEFKRHKIENTPEHAIKLVGVAFC